MSVSTVAPLFSGDIFQDPPIPQWMPETKDSTKPYTQYTVFFPMHAYQ